MTPQDYNQHLKTIRRMLTTARMELSEIKKEKLQLSARVKIERANATIDAAREATDLNVT